MIDSISVDKMLACDSRVCILQSTDSERLPRTQILERKIVGETSYLTDQFDDF